LPGTVIAIGATLSIVDIVPNTFSDVWNLRNVVATISAWQNAAYPNGEVDGYTFWRTVFRNDEIILPASHNAGMGSNNMEGKDYAAAKSWCSWLQIIAPSTE
jgi:hypothetical protein